MNRRQFLAGSSVGLGSAIAGCTNILDRDSDGIAGNSLPSYHTSLPAVEDGQDAGFIHLNVGRFNELAEVESGSPTTPPVGGGDDPAVPLLAAPVIGSLFAVGLGLAFGLVGFGSFGERIFSQFEGELGNEETPVAEDVELQGITFAGGVVVFEGDFDTDAYVESLPNSFAESESRDGYTIYEDSEDGSSDVIAISGNTIVVGFRDGENGLNATESLERVLDAETGVGDRFVDQYPDAEWALRTAGNHGFVLGSVGDTEVEQSEGDDSSFDPLSGTALSEVDASIVVSGASIDIGNNVVDSANADTALTHTSEPVTQSEVEEMYSESDADVSVSASEAEEDGAQRVRISASFSSTNL